MRRPATTRPRPSSPIGDRGAVETRIGRDESIAGGLLGAGLLRRTVLESSASIAWPMLLCTAGCIYAISDSILASSEENFYCHANLLVV